MRIAAALILSFLIPFSAFAGFGADAKVRREWNFTPNDYAKLKAAGGSLQFSERSAWMPESLRASIMSALDYTLNPNLTPSSTMGINRLDFFHGHFVCSGKDERIQKMGEEFSARATAIFKTAGFNQIENPTKETYPAFARAVDQVDELSFQLLTELMPHCENTTVMFHTFEYITEKIGMSTTDARRHLYAPLGGGEITRKEDKPFDLNASLNAITLRDFDAPIVHSFMFNFGFLVDKKGTVHLTQGSGFQLHRFTGVRD